MPSWLSKVLPGKSDGGSGGGGGGVGGIISNVTGNALGRGKVGVPKYADFTITPLPAGATQPSPTASKLLRQVADSAVKSNDMYSVTNSPVCCPAGAGKNELYALRPYIWETKPGCFERRDGQRNPACDKPQGQKQLQNLAMTVSALAFAIPTAADKTAYTQRAEALLNTFFIDPNTRMVPEVQYAQVDPGNVQAGGDKQFAIALRYIVLVSQALRFLPLSQALADGMRAWIQTQATWMETSQQGQAARDSGNNIALWYHAIYASHLAFLDPARAQQHALSTLPVGQGPEAVLGPELQRTRPRHYILFALEAIFIIAGVAFENGPQPNVVAWLGSLLAFARSVPPGDIETEVDNDQRYGLKLAWFERQLARWQGQQIPDGEPDGSAWEGGWNQRARLAYALI